MRVTPSPGAAIVASAFPPSLREARAWERGARDALRRVGWIRPPQPLVYAVARLLVPARIDGALLRMVEVHEPEVLAEARRQCLQGIDVRPAGPEVVHIPADLTRELIGHGEPCPEGVTLRRGEAVNYVDATIREVDTVPRETLQVDPKG